MIFVSLPAAMNGAMRPTTVFIKWCDLNRHFDILILKAKKSYPSDFYVPHLVRFISHLGFEVEEPIIIKERSSELDARIVGRVTHKILISAIEHLGHPDGRKKLKIGAAISSCTLMDNQHLTLSNGDIDTGAASNDRFFSIMSHNHEAGDA